MTSLLDRFLEQPAARADALIRSLSQEEAERIVYDWAGVWARPEQLAPRGHWRVWLLLAGRGYGKSRCATEWARAEIESGRRRRLALLAATAADARDVLVDGPSGFLAICPPDQRPHYEPTKRRLTWPNGAIGTLFSGDDPDQLRGPHCDGGLVDELAKYAYPNQTWDNLELMVRASGPTGTPPALVVATTPRPIPLIVSLVADPDCAVTSGSTYENRDHLAPSFLSRIRQRYEGTRLGRQELHGEVLLDLPGALWSHEGLDATRVRRMVPNPTRIVVGVDPAVSSQEGADETGIIVAARGEDGHGYVLADVSCTGSPTTWATVAVQVFRRYHADCLVAEVNQGGELVEHTIRTIAPSIPYRAVHATRGKYLRAEPVAALFEQGRCHLVGSFPELEDQLCAATPELQRRTAARGSPDRLDGMVWALAEVMAPDLSGSAWSAIDPLDRTAMQQPFVDRDALSPAGQQAADAAAVLRQYGPSQLLRGFRAAKEAQEREWLAAQERQEATAAVQERQEV